MFGVSLVVSLPVRGSTLTAATGGAVVERPRQSPLRAEQPPAVGDGEDRLALLAHAAQERDQIFQRVERLLFAPA